MNTLKGVQTHTIEQSLFADHKSPYFNSYVCVSYVRATFSMMNIRQNILYETLSVNCVPDELIINRSVEETRPLLNHVTYDQTESVIKVSIQFCFPQMIQDCILSETVFLSVLQINHSTLIRLVTYFRADLLTLHPSIPGVHPFGELFPCELFNSLCVHLFGELFSC